MRSKSILAALLTCLAATVGAATKPPGIDLEVTYINRAPMYERYRVDYPGGKPVLQAGTENTRRWPTNGEMVTFTAHVANKGTLASGPFAYKWFIDGVEVASETHPGLASDQQDTVTYQWNWRFQMDGERVLDDHTVRCTVNPDNVIAETFENNNTIEDRINASTAGSIAGVFVSGYVLIDHLTAPNIFRATGALTIFLGLICFFMDGWFSEGARASLVTRTE